MAAKVLIVVGLVLVAAGLAMKFGVPLGRLPGDIVIRNETSSFYFPVVTCILISVVLSLVMWLLRR
jgi:hypothetical protein